MKRQVSSLRYQAAKSALAQYFHCEGCEMTETSLELKNRCRACYRLVTSFPVCGTSLFRQLFWHTHSLQRTLQRIWIRHATPKAQTLLSKLFHSGRCVLNEPFGNRSLQDIFCS